MKRSKDGRFLGRCSNQLHDRIVARALQTENRSCGSGEFGREGGGETAGPGEPSFTEILRAPATVKREFIKENPQSLRHPGRRIVICNICLEHFAHQAERQSRREVAEASQASTSASVSDSDEKDEHIEHTKTSNSNSNVGKNDGVDETVKCLPKDCDRVNAVLQQLSDFDDEELAKVARFLAKSQTAKIKRDIQTLNASNASVDELCQSNLNKWVSERNVVIREFLEELSGNTCSESPSDIAKAVEHIYHIVNSKTILPISLAENLVSYSITNSKLASDIHAANSPAGGYTYLVKWLEKQSCEPEPAPCGDVLTAFDNDQVIGKSYHARHDNKVKTSVITSVCFAEVNGSLQTEERLKPGLWKSPEQISCHVDEILNSESGLNKAVNVTHYKELYTTLESRLQKVVSEQSESLTDAIDREVTLLRDKRDWKVCSECQTKNLKSKRICCSCGHRLRLSEEKSADTLPKKSKNARDSTTYTHVKFQSPEEQEKEGSARENEFVSVKAGDPIFLNPNSHQNLITVFKDIGRQLGIKKYTGGRREWAAVTCDGLPFTLAQRVIKETYTCAVCGESIFTTRAYDEHFKEHGDEHLHKKSEKHQEFDWLLLKIGHGHVEMNMLRSFFELNWQVFVKDVAMSMGFCSEAAQKYAKRGSDHHKSWELLQILFFGCIDELLVPYVRDSIRTDTEPTPNGFMEWSQQIQNKRYQYMQEQILTYAQAIITMRTGIRHNDMSKVMAGRLKFSNVFHARNHPKYQLIEVIELANFLAAPKEIKEFLTKFQAISTSGDPTRCEDMDFVLENINKKSKAWIPKGVPTKKDWIRIFRNLGKFDDLRSAVLNRTMRSDDSQSQETYVSSHAVREEDVTAWRAHLRESEFLLQPMENVPFTSVSKDELAESLLTFSEQASERKRFFVESLLGNEGCVGQKPGMVFVTQEEAEYHNDVHNQTKDQIALRITSAIQTLDDECVKSSLLHEWETSVKSRKKEDFVVFFQRVQEEVDQQGEFIPG